MSEERATKYILITGGVLSGLGKGVIASSTGLILKALGFRVTSIKIDPYLNIDAGTMSPFEHGEVYVLDDGGEADLDLGNYERFIDITLTKDNNITTGKVYNQVIEKERRGAYLGRTVQVIPHITDAIQDWVTKVSKVCVDGSGKEPEICIIEMGGTVGDIESGPFIEAMRQFQFRVGKRNFCSIHVSLVPVVGAVGELKTKPTQASVRELRALGLSPDLVVCRSTAELTAEVKGKISSFCHVKPEAVISVYDVSNLFRVPLLLSEQSVPGLIMKKFDLAKGSYLGEALQRHQKEALKEWSNIAEIQDQLNGLSTDMQVHIAVIGKYTGLSDSYLSVIKALQHSALEVRRKLVIDWVESSELEKENKINNKEKYYEMWSKLKNAHGILIPGGFGDRGTEGMILAAEYARVNKKPYLGVCLGLQIAVIEYARHVLGFDDATSTEFDKTAKTDVVMFMPEVSKEYMGGTMRLGKRRTVFVQGVKSKARILYGNVDYVDERHRHRYEVNPKFIGKLEDEGLSFVGFDVERERAEIIEIENHPYFVATQFHPEFKSRPMKPSPVFLGLLLAASGQLEKWCADREKK